MPTTPRRSRLAAIDVEVAGTGDQVDAAARPGTVGQHRDRLRTADGVHLVDPQQGARRPGSSASGSPVSRVGGAASAERPHAGDLGGHDVHHEAATPAARGRRGRRARRGRRGWTSVGDQPLRAPPRRPSRASSSASLVTRSRRIDSSSAARTAGSSAARASASAARGHAGVGHVDAVELGRELADRVDAPGPDGLDDRRHHMRRGLDVELGARHARAVVDGRRIGAPAGRCGGSGTCRRV